MLRPSLQHTQTQTDSHATNTLYMHTFCRHSLSLAHINTKKSSLQWHVDIVSLNKWSRVVLSPTAQIQPPHWGSWNSSQPETMWKLHDTPSSQSKKSHYFVTACFEWCSSIHITRLSHSKSLMLNPVIDGLLQNKKTTFILDGVSKALEKPNLLCSKRALTKYRMSRKNTSLYSGFLRGAYTCILKPLLTSTKAVIILVLGLFCGLDLWQRTYIWTLNIDVCCFHKFRVCQHLPMGAASQPKTINRKLSCESMTCSQWPCLIPGFTR